jgi:hypothetical protein
VHGDVKLDNVLLKTDAGKQLGFAPKVGPRAGVWDHTPGEGIDGRCGAGQFVGCGAGCARGRVFWEGVRGCRLA